MLWGQRSRRTPARASVQPTRRLQARWAQSAQATWREGLQPAIHKGKLARMGLGTALCIPAGCRPVHVELVGARGLPPPAAALASPDSSGSPPNQAEKGRL